MAHRSRGAFTPEYLSTNPWLTQFQPETPNAIASLQQAEEPSIVSKFDRCSVFQTTKLNLLDAQCIVEEHS